jgi:hypothetical protein
MKFPEFSNFTGNRCVVFDVSNGVMVHLAMRRRVFDSEVCGLSWLFDHTPDTKTRAKTILEGVLPNKEITRIRQVVPRMAGGKRADWLVGAGRHPQLPCK